MSRNVSKWAMVAFSLLLAVGGLECGLRVYAALWHRYQLRQAQDRLLRDPELRILCLGDSLTGEPGTESYPGQLNRLLAGEWPQRKTEVINAGIPDADSFDLLNALPEYLQREHPQIVIAMMGMNDTYRTRVYTEERSSGPLGLKTLQLVRWAASGARDIWDRFSPWPAVFVRYCRQRGSELGKLIGAYLPRQRMGPPVLLPQPSFREGGGSPARKLTAQGWQFRSQRRWQEAIDCFSAAVKVDLHATKAYLGRAWIRYEQGDYAAAQEDFNRALRIDGESKSARLGLAWIKKAQGEVSAAAETFAGLLERWPQYSEAYAGWGWCLTELRRFPEAIERFATATRIEPLNVDAWYGLGTAYRQQHRYPQALEALQQAVRQDPQHDRAQAAMGWVYLRMFRPEQARAAFAEAVRLNPDNGDAVFGSAWAAYDTGAVEQAMGLFASAAQLSPHSSDVLNAWGWACLAGKEYAAALGHFETAAGLSPGNSDSLAGKAWVLIAQGQYAAAQAYVQEVLSHFPACLPVYIAGAQCAYQQDDVAGALDYLERATAREPLYEEALLRRAEIFLELGRLKDATDVFQDCGALRPDNDRALAGLGTVRLRQGDYLQAESLFSQALALNPLNQTAAVGHAWVLLRTGNLKDAHTAFAEAVRRWPDSQDARIGCGRTYFMQRRYGEAESVFQRLWRDTNRSWEAAAGLGDCALAQARPAAAARWFSVAAGLDPEEYTLGIRQMRALRQIGAYAHANDVLAGLLCSFPDRIDTLPLIGWEFSRPEITEQVRLRMRHLATGPLAEEYAMAWLGRYYLQRQEWKTAQLWFRRCLRQYPVSRAGWSGLIHCAERSGHSAHLAELIGRFSQLQKDSAVDTITVYNYLALQRVLAQQGIQLVCVAYPGRSTDRLRTALSGCIPPPLFVEFPEMVRQSRSQSGDDALFTDWCAGDFGHFTVRAHQLVAAQIAAILVRNIPFTGRKNVK